MTRDCFCLRVDCCEATHCGRPSYGCWFKSPTDDELMYLETLAKATVQQDQDLTWMALPSSGGVWRDQCGWEPVVLPYGYAEERGKYAEPEPPGVNWDDDTQSREVKDKYIAEVKATEQRYFDDHPDVAFIGEADPGMVLRLIQEIKRLRKMEATK